MFTQLPLRGDFDVCQALAKKILGDKGFAQELFSDPDRFTSANSISVGRLLPQAVYPFFAYSRVASHPEKIIASVPSGNFGDMMGTVIAKEMGLPVGKLVCGVNENKEFPIFLETGKYKIKPVIKCPSSAMMVSHPSNFARLVDFYGGHIIDERDEKGNVKKPGVIKQMPDLDSMRKDIFSASVSNAQHFETMKKVYENHKITLDPHGSVGWKGLDIYLKGKHGQLAVVYETADPGKFPEDVEKAIGVLPGVPARIKEQEKMKERIYKIKFDPGLVKIGEKEKKILSKEQYTEAKALIKQIFA